MSRPRNFSNWAYWRLHHEAALDGDPCPLDDLASQLEPWRARVRERLLAMLGPPPETVLLDLESTPAYLRHLSGGLGWALGAAA